ncbi:MAG: hypothetical protein LBC84_01850 [Prevotellaceae bacterium]|jgi:hypothetical protein|nr:hypothetical protein [Prevotellaceae bacterium]
MEEKRVTMLRVMTLILAVVAVALIGVLAWVWVDRYKMIESLQTDKDDLTVQLQDLRLDYGNIHTQNDTLSLQLEREREKVDQLIDRVQQTEASNRSKIREYEKELGTLRSIMRHYIVQIDSLNTLNTTLRQDAVAARDEARKSQREYNELKSTADEYARKVEVGSVVKGRNFGLTALLSNGKVTDRSSRTEKLKCCLFLMENDIANRGPRKIYLRVKGPDGVLMTSGDESVFVSGGESMIYSASREVDYQGADIEVCVFFGQAGLFKKGVYSVDVYTVEAKLGSVDVSLK